ncbi:hypothetical protein GCM10007350_02390 [Jeongeupia chitinilytica]|uniref:Uncharacterized protein n=1 Tax=Jeongeupia chitinilytica TaxID=1041641 RepID=A0ABQ3GUQ1_9NEIS|nr:hypothetical protein GCM10007350_02390 [Jeongeupia chitinilytica]
MNGQESRAEVRSRGHEVVRCRDCGITHQRVNALGVCTACMTMRALDYAARRHSTEVACRN